MMTRLIVFCSFFSLLSSVAFSHSTDNHLERINQNILDLYYGPNESYESRIQCSAQEFAELLTAIDKSGDEGDAKVMEKAYNSFLALLIKADRLNELDEWNREFASCLTTGNPICVYSLLCMAAAYSLGDGDSQSAMALNSVPFQGKGQSGLKFLKDFRWLYSTASLFDKARIEAINGQLLLVSSQVGDASESFRKAASMIADSRGKESQEYILFKMYEEIPYMYISDFKKAEEIAQIAKNLLERFEVSYQILRKRIIGSDFVEYASLLGRMSIYCRNTNQDAASLKHAADALDAAYENHGPESLRLMPPFTVNGMPSYGPTRYLDITLFDIKKNYADLLYQHKEIEMSKSLYKELLGDYRLEVNNTSRFEIWDIQMMQQQIAPLVSLAPICVNRYFGDPQIEELAYNCALQYKNFSMMTENLLLKMVRLENDTEVNKVYDKILLLKQKLDHPETVNYALINDSIRLMNEQLLYYLDFRTYGQILDADWHVVQEHLPPNSIAIEFMLSQEEEDAVYYANIITSTHGPSCVRLCTEEDLMSILTPYTSLEASDLIWAPIKEYLENVKTIFFSPTGVLYKIAIEYFTDGSTMFNQKYKIYRLSSTRELAGNNTADVKGRRAVIYGGIDYGTPVQSADDVAMKQPMFLERAIGNMEYLPQTRIEMENIANVLNRSIQVDTVSGMSATEESFKSLTGATVDILHVATHGFYIPKYRRSELIKATLNPFNSLEDQSLSRSGLLFAGANRAIQHQHVEGDDGLLTAKEISQMDLSGLKLVTLSACETALGDISGEGVFGLQRGFKKAGAKTMIMSLWRVNDIATRVFMTSFYELLGNGKSIYDAFSQAQVSLKNYHQGQFDDPKYWAAFILIDAL